MVVEYLYAAIIQVFSVHTNKHDLSVVRYMAANRFYPELKSLNVCTHIPEILIGKLCQVKDNDVKCFRSKKQMVI